MLTATPGTPATITFPTPPAPPAGQRQPKPFNRLAEAMRSRHSSRRAGQMYVRKAGSYIRTTQAVVGHTDVAKTVICTLMLTKGDREVRSPMDAP
jgi:hypothetical protein